jgi:hypothetical protein
MQGVFNETFAYTYDVGRDLLKVQDIVTTYDIPFIGPTTGVPGLFYGPWWYYFLVMPFIFSGGDPRGLVIFIVLTGMLGIMICYLLGKRMHKPSFGLLFASLVAVSPSLVSTTSQIWNPNSIPLFILAILAVGLSIYTTKQERVKLAGFAGIGFLSGLILDFEIVYGVLFLTGLLITLFFYKKYCSIKRIFALTSGFFLVLLPRILFELSHQAIMTKAMIHFIQEGRDGSGSGIQFQFINSVISEWRLFINTVAAESELLGLIILISSMWVLFRYWGKLEGFLRMMTVFMLVQVVVFLVGMSFFFEAIWDHYLVGLPIMYAGLVSISWYLLYKNFSSYKKIILAVIFLILMINLSVPKRISGFLSKPTLNDPAQYAVHKTVVDYIYQDAKGQSFKYVLYTPPVHDYTYSYLFSW